MRRFATTLLVVCLVLATTLADGQSRAQEIVISGVVTDASGSLMPNASVLLVAVDGKRLATSETDAAGLFHIPSHGPGDRDLEIRHSGFKPFVTRIHVARGNAEPIKAVLGNYVQNLDVTADSDSGALSTDSSENRDAAVVTSDTLEHLPVFDQDYVSALANFLDQGSVGTEGATIVVDGMEQKDAGVTASAIESVKVNNDPYSAEYSRPGRGRIEITTKSPDPVYDGTFNFIFRDYHLDARNAFASTRPPEQRRIFEGVLTGPVPKISKTFFLLSADYQLDDVQSTLVAQLPTGILQENVPSPIRAIDGAARLTHDISDTHNVTLQITYEGRKRSNQLGSPGQNLTAAQTPGSGSGSAQTQVLGGYVLPEAGQNLSGVERHVTFTDKLVLSPSLLNQLQVIYEHNRDSTASTTEAPQINVQNAFVSGGAQATQLNTETTSTYATRSPGRAKSIPSSLVSPCPTCRGAHWTTIRTDSARLTSQASKIMSRAFRTLSRSSKDLSISLTGSANLEVSCRTRFVSPPCFKSRWASAGTGRTTFTTITISRREPRLPMLLATSEKLSFGLAAASSTIAPLLDRSQTWRSIRRPHSQAS